MCHIALDISLLSQENLKSGIHKFHLELAIGWKEMSDRSNERARIILPIFDQATHHLMTREAKDLLQQIPALIHVLLSKQ